MMKKALKILLTFALALIFTQSQAQFIYHQRLPQWYDDLKVDSIFLLPTADTANYPASEYFRDVILQASNKKVYYSDSTSWKLFGSAEGGGSVDSSLYVTITRLRDSLEAVRADFPAAVDLSDYLKASDTTGHWAPKGSYLHPADTVGKWAPKGSYLHPGDTTDKWAPKGAEKNVNADWDAPSGDAEILHKPTIPTSVSQLPNDAGYLNSDSLQAHAATVKAPLVYNTSDSTVGLDTSRATGMPTRKVVDSLIAANAGTGNGDMTKSVYDPTGVDGDAFDYDNLHNTPTIPTVNNATLTIQGTGAASGSQTFTANSSTNKTATINVPTTLSSFTNDPGFTTASDVGGQIKDTLDGKIILDEPTDSVALGITQQQLDDTAFAIRGDFPTGGSGGSGDMAKSVYDPTGIDKDAFDYDNFYNTPTPYSLPTASSSVLGGVKVGSGLSIASGVLSANAPTWSSITSKPTTLSGYGITDAYTKTQADARYLQSTPTLDAVLGAGNTSSKNIILSGVSTFSGQVNIGIIGLAIGPSNTYAVPLDLGSTTTAVSPYINFHSSGTSSSYDSRLLASGGSSTAGGGTLSFYGSAFSVNGDLSTTGSATANSFIKSGGTSSQFLMGNGGTFDKANIIYYKGGIMNGDLNNYNENSMLTLYTGGTISNTPSIFNSQHSLLVNFDNETWGAQLFINEATGDAAIRGYQGSWGSWHNLAYKSDIITPTLDAILGAGNTSTKSETVGDLTNNGTFWSKRINATTHDTSYIHQGADANGRPSVKLGVGKYGSAPGYTETSLTMDAWNGLTFHGTNGDIFNVNTSGALKLPYYGGVTGDPDRYLYADADGNISTTRVLTEQIKKITADYTLTPQDENIIANPGSSGLTITLPSGLPDGTPVRVRNISSYTVTISSAGHINDGSITSITLAQGESAILVYYLADTTWYQF